MEPAADDHAWADVEVRLVETLADLDVDEFVVVAEPAPPTPPRRGLLRGRAKPAPVRMVQFRRDDASMLYGECVGATLFGGDWEVPAEVHDRVRALGWLAPGDPDPTGTQPAYPNYWQCRPREQAADLARTGVAALMLLGAEPGTLTWQRART